MHPLPRIPVNRRSTRRALLQTLVLLLAIGFFGFCVWNSALLELLPIQQGFVFCLTLGVAGVIGFASARIGLALVASGALFFALKFIAVMKLRYLAAPLVPADFVYFARESLLETLKQYPNLYAVLLGTSVILPVMLGVLWYFDLRFLPPLRKGLGSIGLRLAGIGLSVLGLWWCLQPGGPFTSVYQSSVWNTVSGKTQLSGFFVAIDKMTAHLPERSDAETAARDWAASSTPANTGANDATTHPDIVLVLEESTFDPRDLVACDIAQCEVDLFAPDADTRGHGPLRVHTFGGSTWVSEFSVLTGLPQTLFGPAGAYAPFVLAPRMQDSLPRQLRRLGYQTIAVYPVAGSFLNARNAYNAYGFDHFLDASDLGIEVWHTGDAQMFAAARKVYEQYKRPGQPVFLMVLTLEQHGPHDGRALTELPPPFNQELLPNLPATEALNLSTYLASLHRSSEAMRGLQKDFLQRPQPTVLVHFGDHQPAFGGLIRRMPRTLPTSLQDEKDYITYYMIKSNFASRPLPEYPVLDIAFLPSLLLDAADLPQGAYFSASSLLRERCEGRYDTCPDSALMASYHAWVFDHLGIYR